MGTCGKSHQWDLEKIGPVELARYIVRQFKTEENLQNFYSLVIMNSSGLA